jgi:DNA-binding transcriptional MerR regulator
MRQDVAQDLTIDELARQAGMTVRNVRAHQTRGLLPPPVLRGRTGFYGPEHLARLGLIKDMQSAGFNLNGIKSLLDAAPPGSGQELLEFERALMAPWGPEEPEIMEAHELLAMFENPPPGEVERAVELGLVVPLDDGRMQVPMPTLLRAGRELRDMGFSSDKQLETLATLMRHVRAIASAFIELFLDGVWRPFVERGESAEELPEVRRALERLRPLASDAMAAAFNSVMTADVQKAFGREIAQRGDSELEAMG